MLILSLQPLSHLLTHGHKVRIQEFRVVFQDGRLLSAGAIQQLLNQVQVCLLA
jgi:hypothetical protein